MSRAALAAALVVGVLGCVATASERAPRGTPPPPPRGQVQPPRPSADSVWIPGSWRWNGVEHVWEPGRWESPRPTPGG